ncbi:MAG: TIGR03808 family TAT-translocated repetitive protein, partial [Flavobacteriaceae bacterium]
NEIRQCDDNGILVWQSEKRHDGARITGNRISRIGAVPGGSGLFGNGINIYRAGGVLISGNHISDCAFTAVRVNGGDNCQIIGNNCARMGEVALYVEFAFEGAVVANNIVDTAGMGISVTNFGNAGGRLAVVSGNLVRNLFTPAYEEARGVGIGVEADTAVTGNVVENAALFGIVAGWGAAMRDITINGNIVRGSPVGIAVSVSPGAGHAAITGNRIEGADKSAIQAMDHNDAVGDDMTRPGVTIDPRLTVSGNSAG